MISCEIKKGPVKKPGCKRISRCRCHADYCALVVASVVVLAAAVLVEAVLASVLAAVLALVLLLSVVVFVLLSVVVLLESSFGALNALLIVT